jgi:predicted RNase H-like HicB family nuclease
MKTGFMLLQYRFSKVVILRGGTYEEAQENIKDAIRLHIEARRALGEPIPIEVAIDEVQVVA